MANPSSSNSKQSKLRHSDDEDPSSSPQLQLNHPFLRRCTCSNNFFKKQLPLHGLASNPNLRRKTSIINRRVRVSIPS
ncbi:Pathogenesis-related thaumatin superfamily protein [Prunus dulcis]|uniref:Pathogenesis-related thaumatin superfamily protein n=1 Tax=Prunus dulcis TaxID=3755 RepID=A0A4Y1RSG7_PRUDU|nr:Pathogenesis-related thaumatin superfamily protein [Prunus dulcis]